MTKLSRVRPSLQASDFQYLLPDDRIARHPLPRGSARLLHHRAGVQRSYRYRQLPELLPKGSHLIFNETKVVQARLLFPRPGGSVIEVFCLEPQGQMSMEQAMQQKGRIALHCLVGKAKKWKEETLQLPLQGGYLSAQKIDREGGIFKIAFSWDSDQTFAEVLEQLGKTPLPPYLKREATPADAETYQTVYARRSGSVAAPTAGLHFSEALLDELVEQGHSYSKLTLHVGAGTFKPMAEGAVSEHHMHGEEFAVDDTFLQELLPVLTAGRPIIPVGTTSLRALESMYWLGALALQGKDPQWQVPQWVAFDWEGPYPEPREAWLALRQMLQQSGHTRLHATTELMLLPGYPRHLISGLLTNFHQPGSTLLLLVAALIGDAWRELYQYALDEDYRFLSYGDGCFLDLRP